MSQSRARQYSVLFVLGVTAALSPVSIDMLAPSLPQLSEDMGVSAARIELTIYAFLVGYGLAPSLWGRLSDSIGRRPVMFMGMVIYCLSCIASIYAPGVDELIVLRVVQGVGAAAGATMARAIVRDIYGAGGTARGMATMISMLAIIPFLMPIAGGMIARQFSPEACFIAMALVGLGGAFAYWILVPETLPATSKKAGGGAETFCLLPATARLPGTRCAICSASRPWFYLAPTSLSFSHKTISSIARKTV